ncbi:hypothetical protein [Xylophilus sp. GOD-11R]|uniref:hypothetical protein n=1 Tax=Xylophilus sp. GOD-11R TaxID=3089814 RepID=UPI00298C0FE4|nr:hypothetical protein [Xylophilus sp. GOD-11R]WPB56221.1 hypothetical protein R9X41_19060 [Xylophilus sp. GOD-11R]
MRSTLMHLHPSQLADALKQRQWLRPSPTPQQLALQLAQLQAEIPYACFAKRTRVTAWINDRHPENFCWSRAIEEYFRRHPLGDGGDGAITAITAMMADGSIGLFVDPADEHRRLDLSALLDHLRYGGHPLSPE